MMKELICNIKLVAQSVKLLSSTSKGIFATVLAISGYNVEFTPA